MTNAQSVQVSEGSAHTHPLSEGEEIRAPNGRVVVLVDGFWTGYLLAGDGCETSGKSMCLFEVSDAGNGKLRVHCRSDCPKKDKLRLNREIYHEKKIKSFDALTDAGDRCQLFTLQP